MYRIRLYLNWSKACNYLIRRVIATNPEYLVYEVLPGVKTSVGVSHKISKDE